MINSALGKALIVDDEKTNRLILKSLLGKQGYQTIEAVNGQEAVDLFHQEHPSIIFMDVMMPVLDGYEATRQIKAASANHFVPVIFLTAMSDEEALAQCIEAGGDDFLVKPYDRLILQSKIRSMQRIAALNREVQGMYSMIHREQEIAESVFVNAIQSSNIENPYIKQVVRPAGIFSGDMVLSAYSPSRDLFFLTGDFTGHGLLAALGAMPVSEVFRAMTTKGFSPEEILVGINKKLKSLLPVGMFFGAQLVVVNHDLEHVRVFNAGMPDVIIVDGPTNQIKHRLVSTGLPLGVEATIDPKEMLQYAPIAYNDKILMHSDGLTEARNASDREFGSQRLLESINRAPANQVFDQIFEDLDGFCGDITTQADDVTLVEITCVHEVLPEIEVHDYIRPSAHLLGDRGEWKLSLRFNGTRLRETNPVPILVSYLLEMEELEAERQSLFTVMTELYVNALDHGVLGLDSRLKSDPAGFEAYFQTRESRLASLDSGYVIFNLSVEQQSTRRSILLRIEDSGKGFDYENHDPPAARETALSGRGILLIQDLCESLEYHGKGNIAIARFSWSTS
ncbi:MAG: SpoIIE family protein phosphatase [Gammaproteobacteria bacterium]|nr:SpoIIE family protein phosphatase [Gammaproteobacteria bacterium]MDH3534320.1 SpoIIE family protein phosphatase [Gammaproteobacteria bacterium]